MEIFKWLEAAAGCKVTRADSELATHRAVNHLNVLHIISWCLLSSGPEARWDECHHSV